MAEEQRGIIRNRERSNQVKDYSTLRFGNITPSDIDGFLELEDKLMILFEYKLGNAPFPYGQKLGLERLCDAVQEGKKPCYILLCQHDALDPKKDIDTGNALVVKFRHKGIWKNPPRDITAKEMVSMLMKLYLNPKMP